MSGILDVIGDVIGNVGINAETTAATQKALASPTLENIHAVETAFENAGTSAPPELMNTLYERYYQAIRDNPYWAGGGAMQFFSQYWPWLLIGGVALYAISKKGN